ncbi:aspartate/glutamate racemase family protein [Glycomyces sp. A-F 0318]|uniref:aspartate/glutamate racemase family protein n=1 Tax=Glycomyces amatae TaxID=2881355 RepID=UPI001E2A2D52|nr:aspartate/glutamate racemase family protein [Glycomyces amatae]MCD0445424.1 aspartate/glutamate racemase family protein [Glycomyces amatae]
MSGERPRIALVHGTDAAVAPAVEGLAAAFPEAEPWNLLDDRLLPDADAAGGLTPELAERMSRLIGFARAGGASGVLLTCSMYGSVAAAARLDIPVLAPDEAAFARVAGAGWGGVLVVGSFATAAQDAGERLRSALAAAGASTRVDAVTAGAALGPSREGDTAALTRALLDAVSGRAADAVVLAQYSLAPAAGELERRLGLPVVAGPQAAAAMLKERLNA